MTNLILPTTVSFCRVIEMKKKYTIIIEIQNLNLFDYKLHARFVIFILSLF